MFVASVLGVLALAGGIGSAVQWFGDDDVDVAGYERQISQVTLERDELIVANKDLAASVDQLEADVALGIADLDASAAALNAVTADLAATDAELDRTSAGLADARASNTAMAADLAASTARADELTASVRDLQASIDSLTQERDALVAMFPMIVDTSLVGVDVTGTYAADWFAAYNSGLADIALPDVAQVAITRNAEGWLNVTIPGVLSAGLMRTDGALFTIVDTNDAVPPVDGVARPARVAITIYAGETVTAADGTTTVTDLGLSIAVSTPEFETAPAGVALFGATLTPQS